jgi:hypothetical protein
MPTKYPNLSPTIKIQNYSQQGVKHNIQNYLFAGFGLPAVDYS